ncbi:hypothetical protein AB6A40_006000 [Gnathostoma spinigerum]|uniref:Uncharacterized protein n=1 Tax=Gnathostoma spinigerum TaxID=75299 RepID=A0ABD6EJ56_9BILA
MEQANGPGIDDDDVYSCNRTIETTLHNLANAQQFAFDIGSVFVKIAYSSNVARMQTNSDHTVGLSDSSAFRLHCCQFRIEKLKECLRLMKEVNLQFALLMLLVACIVPAMLGKVFRSKAE